MNILEELFYGNINPYEHGFEQDPQCEQLRQHLSHHEQALTGGFTGEQQAQFEKYRDGMQALRRRTEREAFLQGLWLGGKLMLAVVEEET